MKTKEHVSAGLLFVLMAVPALWGLFGPREHTRTMSLVGILAVSAAVFVWTQRTSMRRRNAILEEREPLTEEEIYARYFSDSGLDKGVVSRIWIECAGALGLSWQRLRPSDRFQDELRPSSFFDTFQDRLDELAMRAANRAREKGITLELRSFETVGELARRLAQIETTA